MLGEPIESGRRNAVPVGQSLGSFALHIALVLGAIGATRRPPQPPVPRPIAVDIVFEVPAHPAASAVGPVGAVASTPVLPSPGLPALTVPVLAPAEVPPLTVGSPVDPKALAAALHGGGLPVATQVGGTASPGGGGILLPAEADRAPELAPGARCLGAYPAALQSMGVGGRAVLQFVVGLDGRVDTASVRIVSSSHPAFGSAARDGVLAASCRYRPGEYQGAPVRVLVQQAAAFRVGR